MMRNDGCLWILLFVMLIVMLGGAPLLGGMIMLVLEIVGFFILAGLVLSLIFRYRIRRAQRQAQERGEEFGGYTWHFGGYQNTTRPTEPEVKIKNAPQSKKRVNENVGEYVDFDEK